MDTYRLRVFAEVARQGSFTRAARTLRLQQPSVSHHIAALEQEVGTLLIERLARSIRLTPAGDALLPYARQAHTLVNDGLQAARDAGQIARQRLLLGCAETPATYIVPEIIRQIRQISPPLSVRLMVGNAERIRAAVLAGDVDLAVLSDRDEHPLLVNEGTRADEFVVAVAADDPWATRARIEPAELAERYLLLRERGAGTRSFVDALLRETGLQPADTLEVASVEAMKRLAEAGVGVAVVPSIAVQREATSGVLRLLPITADSARINYCCLRHKDKPATSAVNAFVALFRQLSTTVTGPSQTTYANHVTVSSRGVCSYVTEAEP